MKLGSAGEWKTWFREGTIGWVAFVLLIAGAACLYTATPTSDVVRRIGFAYELIGILVVFVEIARASGKNGLTPLHRRMAAYLRRVPLIRQERRVVIAAMSTSASLATARARATVGHPSNATLQQRVRLLERKVDGLDERFEALDARVEAEKKARCDSIAAERSLRENAMSALEGKIRDVEVGGLDLSLFGVFFLLAGVVLTTATPEICWLLDCR